MDVFSDRLGTFQSVPPPSFTDTVTCLSINKRGRKTDCTDWLVLIGGFKQVSVTFEDPTNMSVFKVMGAPQIIHKSLNILNQYLVLKAMILGYPHFRKPPDTF